MALEEWIANHNPLSYLDANKIVIEDSFNLTHFKDNSADTDLFWKKILFMVIL